MNTLSHDGPELVVDSGIRTRPDLLGILPLNVSDRVEAYGHPSLDQCAALRVLARVKKAGWHAAVGTAPVMVSAGALLAWAATYECSDQERFLVEIAAAFIDSRVHVNLAQAAAELHEDEDWLAVIDAIRIVREGLEP